MIVENDLSNVNLLLVDDDKFLTEVLTTQLKKEGFGKILSSENIEDAKKLISIFKPNIILLGVNLPDGTGMDLCRNLRQKGFKKPIIMISDNGDENNIINGLGSGADEYFKKPIRFEELLVRIKAQLRQLKLSDSARFTLGSLEFLSSNKMLSVVGRPKKVTLTEKETLILKMLFRSFPKPVAKEAFLREVWGFQSDLTTHTLETHIYRLRQKIRMLTEITFILKTKHGYGLVAEIL